MPFFLDLPIRSAEFHPIEQSPRHRPRSETLDRRPVLWVYNNHWKSAPRNPAREPIRCRMAEVQRTLVDARLAEDPAGRPDRRPGDLNSHYNTPRNLSR